MNVADVFRLLKSCPWVKENKSVSKNRKEINVCSTENQDQDNSSLDFLFVCLFFISYLFLFLIYCVPFNSVH